MSSTNYNIGIVLLAAGGSSRLGSPKQLLPYNGKTLIRHSLDEAVNTQAGSIVVVVGANANLLAQDIGISNVSVAENTEWQEGMASSIRTGLTALAGRSPLPDAVILMVCDQPFISAVVLNDIISTHLKTGNRIVACNYGEAIGPPTLFHQSLFAELMQLQGDAGAKIIVQRYQDEVATVLFPKGSIDIDSMEDYISCIKE